ncbi:NADH dehydrogenase ubiquinone Fe-S protein 4 [Methylobacterium nodulans]|uniref:ETC complex I subunit conserved region n=1 Tax=Methylobacterium nodulans (strain LMG 21967 / CNCM I-2342 / ORS 2060) TaxID=460265 RepID=B8I9W2_METNO|nr:NADH dehydrogenase ubiquinone Fe-S protein 4 [Methylobacterium nodulans]ACL57190.1 ETC complex I subunit conserved region [Methylobacterium nodulans ORS 2060]
MSISFASTPGIGHNSGCTLPIVPPPSWPPGTQVRISRRQRPVTTSGRARDGEWVLRFERHTAPEIEPLMGWTAGDDTLATQVELRFASREDAVAYAERQGLCYRLDGCAVPVGCAAKLPSNREYSDTAGQLYATALTWMDASYGRAIVERRPDFERALVNPAAVFGSPAEVLHDPSLLLSEKREVLRRWAWDAWLLEVAADEAMAGGEPSQLDEVTEALAALDRAERTRLIIVTRTDGEERLRSGLRA